MQLILVILLIATSAGHRVTESVEDLPPDAFKNTTTLYPVSNHTNNEKNKINGGATIWKLETAFAESSFDKMSSNSSENETIEQENKTKNVSEEFKPSPQLGTIFEDDILEIPPPTVTEGEFRPMKKPATGFVRYNNVFRLNAY